MKIDTEKVLNLLACENEKFILINESLMECFMKLIKEGDGIDLYQKNRTLKGNCIMYSGVKFFDNEEDYWHAKHTEIISISSASLKSAISNSLVFFADLYNHNEDFNMAITDNVFMYIYNKSKQ